MSSLSKGESMGTKLVELFANRVVERRNMINNYLRGRACIERVRGGWFQGEYWFWAFWFLSFLCSPWAFLALLSLCVDFELFLLIWALSSSFLPFCLVLPVFLLFVGFCAFSSSRWPSWVFSGFLGLLAVLHGILDSNFKLCAFVVNGLIKGEIEKPSGPLLGLIVMSHWLGEVWIRIRDSFVLFFFYLCFVQRIVFACLVVCRWQVRHGVQRREPWQE
jgi:hypothetical protein